MEVVESLHMVVFHWIIDDLNRRFAELAPKAPTSALAAMSGRTFLGIEVGGTKLQLALRAGRWVDPRPRTASHPARGRGECPARPDLRRRLLRLASSDRTRPAAVGIGFGGPVDVDRGVILRSHQVEGWEGFALADWARQALGIPLVAVQNDADTAGSGRGPDSAKWPVAFADLLHQHRQRDRWWSDPGRSDLSKGSRPRVHRDRPSLDRRTEFCPSTARRHRLRMVDRRGRPTRLHRRPGSRAPGVDRRGRPGQSRRPGRSQGRRGGRPSGHRDSLQGDSIDRPGAGPHCHVARPSPDHPGWRRLAPRRSGACGSDRSGRNSEAGVFPPFRGIASTSCRPSSARGGGAPWSVGTGSRPP